MPTTPSSTHSVLTLDVGAKRVGVAVASRMARLPRPLTTLEQRADFLAELGRIIKSEEVDTIVVGLPRGLEGQNTAQTTAIETFVQALKAQFSIPIYLQDEALTSRQAEAELTAGGKPYRREDIDALAATYILQDFLNEDIRRKEPV